MFTNNLKENILLLGCLCCTLLCVLGISELRGQSPIEKKIFEEVNLFRGNPKDYYLKHRKLLSKGSGSDKVFEKVPASPRLIWSDSLFKEAKNAKTSNFRSNGLFTKSFCGYAAFGSSESNPDSFMSTFISENLTTFLSPDYTHIGIYYYEETFYSTKYKCFYAYIGTSCGKNRLAFTFPAQKVSNLPTVDVKKIDTAANEKYLSEQEKEMVREINFARCFPAAYADIISNYLISRGEISFNDWLAGQEIVEELRNLTPMNPLLPDSRLYQCAKNHGLDEKKRGYSGHTGSDNSNPFDRIQKALGEDYIEGNENLVGDSSPREAVISLLVDGGIASRGHRYNIINPKWTHVGCYHIGAIGDFPSNYVQNFATIE